MFSTPFIKDLIRLTDNYNKEKHKKSTYRYLRKLKKQHNLFSTYNNHNLATILCSKCSFGPAKHDADTTKSFQMNQLRNKIANHNSSGLIQKLGAIFLMKIKSTVDNILVNSTVEGIVSSCFNNIKHVCQEMREAT